MSDIMETPYWVIRFKYPYSAYVMETFATLEEVSAYVEELQPEIDASHLRCLSLETGNFMRIYKVHNAIYKARLQPLLNVDESIDNLGLSVRVYRTLDRAGIQTIADVVELLMRGEDALLAVRSFGEKSLDELLDALREHGYIEDDEGDDS